jgi:outer membrane protein, multidrug efflux system
VWKKAGSRAAGAMLDAEAARADLEAIAVSLVAEVTETWFELLSQRAQRELLERQIEINETFLELIQLRFRQGLASSLDIYQQRQQVVATRAQLPLVDAAIELLHHRLAVLVGDAPQTGAGPDAGRRALPELPPMPGTGVPADLLDRRPDVRAARLRAEAADHRVAVAVADRLPSLSLTGSLSTQSNTIGDLFRTPLWSLAGNLLGPLFDGGRRAAEVDRNRAVVDERLMSYGQALLVAMLEVDGALAQERQQILYITELEEQRELAEDTLRTARDRYREGLSDFLPVLTALQSLQRVELTLIQARRQALSFRVQLCRALGGSWPARIARKDEAN